jgi:hypothetical protein
MSFEDRYGLPLTTPSARAVEAYVEGVDRPPARWPRWWSTAVRIRETRSCSN